MGGKNTWTKFKVRKAASCELLWFSNFKLVLTIIVNYQCILSQEKISENSRNRFAMFLAVAIWNLSVYLCSSIFLSMIPSSSEVWVTSVDFTAHEIKQEDETYIQFTFKEQMTLNRLQVL